MDLHDAISRADLCELLSIAFRFPGDDLAAGLCSGSFAEDVLSCLRELDGEKQKVERLERQFEDISGHDQDQMWANLKREYSRLYLAPGGSAEIFPYEGAFMSVFQGSTTKPSLFLSPTAIDVEKHMKNSGVITKDSRKEPVDSIFNEFEFMMYQYAQLGIAITEASEDDQRLWQQRISEFSSAHVQVWMPLFMQATQEKTQEEAYRVLANTAALALSIL